MSSQTKPKELVLSVEVNARGRGLVAFGGDTLSHVTARAFTHACFYLREGSGHDVIIVRVWDVCGPCLGSGLVRKKIRVPYAMKPCPSCKGGKLQGETLLELTLTREELRDSHLKIVDAY